jgi:hypothetical protein
MDPKDGSSFHIQRDYLQERSIELELILEPGQYMVVPRTTGCGLKRPENAEFDSIKLMDSQGQFHPLFVSTIADIFNKFDLVISHSIDFKEIKAFLEIIGKPAPKDEPAFKAEISSKFNSTPEGGLTLRGFKDWWRVQLINEGEPAIWKWLELLGYDRDLYSVRSRIVTLNFHSRILEVGGGSVEVRCRDAIGTDIDNRVNEMIMEQFG